MTSFHLSPPSRTPSPAPSSPWSPPPAYAAASPGPGPARRWRSWSSRSPCGTWHPADDTDPRIEAWHTAYRSFGTNPRRIRPSVDALGRRFAKKGTLPRINPAVDSYNAVSVRHGLPMRRLRPGPRHRRRRHPPRGRHRVLHPARPTRHRRAPQARRDHLRGRHRGPDAALEPPRRPPHPRHRGLHPGGLHPGNPPRRARRRSPQARGRPTTGPARPARHADSRALPHPGPA